jgi:hypothetical protein
MGRALDKERVDDQPRAGEQREAPGRVEFDSRGNSVWRWAKDVIESTSVLLKRLEVKDLALEPTQKVPVMSGADKSKQKQPSSRDDSARDEDGGKSKHPAMRRDRHDTGGGGFDPYNSR